MPGFSTRAIRAASRVPDAPQPPVNVPIYQSSTFEVSSAEELAELLEFIRPGHSYSRYSNPTHAALEQALAELEGAEACLVTASGMAAIHAVMLSTLRAGDQVLIPGAVYGGVVGLAQEVLERVGIEATQDVGENTELYILMEKDFECLTRPDDPDNADSFPNPTACA